MFSMLVEERPGGWVPIIKMASHVLWEGPTRGSPEEASAAGEKHMADSLSAVFRTKSTAAKESSAAKAPAKSAPARTVGATPKAAASSSTSKSTSSSTRSTSRSRRSS